MPKAKTDRTLADKAIDIKGKQYVEVPHRVRYFIDNYADGSIETNVISQDKDGVLIKATISTGNDENGCIFTGHAYERFDDGYINKTSCIENCETSAVGRALGFMDIGVIDSIASYDEVNRAISQQNQVKPIPQPKPKPAPVAQPQPAKQILAAAQETMESGGGHPPVSSFTSVWKGKTIGDVPGFTEYIAKNVHSSDELDQLYNGFINHFKLSEKQSAWVEKTYNTRYNQLVEKESAADFDESEVPF